MTPEFATTLRKILSSSSSSSPADDPSTDRALADSLLADLTKHIDRLHACQQTYVPGLSGDPEIDELATGLWNVCTRLGRVWREHGGGGGDVNAEGGDGVGIKGRGEVSEGAGARTTQQGTGGKGKGRTANAGRLYLYGRVLAFHLLSVARPRENGRVGVVVRLMRLGLKVVRDCVGESRLPAGYCGELMIDTRRFRGSQTGSAGDATGRRLQRLVARDGGWPPRGRGYGVPVFGGGVFYHEDSARKYKAYTAAVPRRC